MSKHLTRGLIVGLVVALVASVGGISPQAHLRVTDHLSTLHLLPN